MKNKKERKPTVSTQQRRSLMDVSFYFSRRDASRREKNGESTRKKMRVSESEREKKTRLFTTDILLFLFFFRSIIPLK